VLPAPRPYPDELLTSALIRCSRWFNISFGTLVRKVLGLQQHTANFLSTFSLRAVASLYGLSPEHLLWKHTTFPYATAFVSASALSMATRAAMASGSGMIHLRAVMKNALIGLPCRRFCLACLQDDLRQWGESYWHRVHNLPGVFFCTKHGCVLSSTDLTLPDRHVVYQLPTECTPRPGPALGNSPSAMELTIQSESLLYRPQGPGERRSGNDYRSVAISLGLLSVDNRIDETALREMILRCFSPALLHAVDAQEVFKRCGWPASLLRPHWRNVSPLKHLMLEISLMSAGSEYADRLSFRRSPPAAALDEIFEQRAKAELRRALAAGDVLTVRDLVDKIGAHTAYKTRLVEFPRLGKAIREFRTSAAAARKFRPR
jgi:hypothetical protein